MALIDYLLENFNLDKVKNIFINGVSAGALAAF
jgi:hypothetical protein